MGVRNLSPVSTTIGWGAGPIRLIVCGYREEAIPTAEAIVVFP